MKDLLEELAHGGSVDEFMQDQLVLFQVLAHGRAVVNYGRNKEATLHTQTARWVAEKMLGVEFDGNGTCEGVGFKAGENYLERTIDTDSGLIKQMEEVEILA